MAITKQAKKAMRSSARKETMNLRTKREMKAVVKKVRETAQAGNAKEAKGLMPQAYKAIDKAVKKGVIKKNTAARKKSRLSAHVKRAGK